MSDWGERYARFTNEVFGKPVPSDLRNALLYSIYPNDSVWFKKCFDALFAVECDFVQQQIGEMKANDVRGDFTEFGIFQGAWVNRMYEMTERQGLHDRAVWGFDSFKGLSRPHASFDSPYWKEGMYAASRADVERNLQVARRRRIKLVEGFFADSLRSREVENLREVAFARIDCDIYEPAAQCLAFLSRRLSHGAILVFDDWTHDIEFGEARAFAEWVPTVPHLRFEFLAAGPWGHLYLRVAHR